MLFRAGAVVLLSFCAAHTVGGMLSEDSMGAEADAVFAQMKAVQFDFNGSQATWYGFWFGFGMMTSVFLLLCAAVAWQLARVKKEHWSAVAPIAWALVIAQAVTAYLSFRYFFVGPGAFSTIAAILFAIAAMRQRTIAQ